jgi:WD40 repeat protein
MSDGTVLRTLVGHTGMISSLAFSPDGTNLISGSWDYTIKVWQVADGNLLRTLTNSGPGGRIALSPDGTTLASAISPHAANSDWTIRLWRVADGTLQSSLTGHTNSVNDLAFSPDSATLVSGGMGQDIKFWRAADGSLLRSQTVSSEFVMSVAFSPNGTTVATGAGINSDNSIKLWTVTDNRLLRTKTTKRVKP